VLTFATRAPPCGSGPAPIPRWCSGSSSRLDGDDPGQQDGRSEEGL